MDIVLLVCLSASLSRLCWEAGSKTYSGYSAPSSAPQSKYFKPIKEYETQSQIDYDIAVKGASILSDLNLNIVERQRYEDVIKERKNDVW